MLGFTIENEGRAISICCDEEGVATLLEAFEKIRASGGHVHLLSPARGGRALAEKTPWGEETVAEVVVTWAGD